MIPSANWGDVTRLLGRLEPPHEATILCLTDSHQGLATRKVGACGGKRNDLVNRKKARHTHSSRERLQRVREPVTSSDRPTIYGWDTRPEVVLRASSA
jgi:hypothetical protein